MNKDKTKTKFNIIAIIAIVIFCIAIAPVTLQNDTYYTIKIGEHILQNGIDMQDPFAWHELPYTYPHWAYDVFIYIIYAVFGMAGIYASTCILSAILGVTMYSVNCKLAKNQVISFAITLVSIYLLKDYIAARAQLVTFILFILTILFIEKFLETKKKRYGVGLVIIPIIIANVHLAVWPFYFVLFLPYIGEYLVAAVADILMERKYAIRKLKTKIEKLSKEQANEEKIAQLETELENLIMQIEKSKAKRAEAKKEPYKLRITRNDNTKWLIVIMLICVLTGLLTPLGDTPYTYLVKTMQGNTTQNINEHLPMTLIEHEELLCLLIAYLAVLTFTKVKIQLKDLFMIGGLAFLMIFSRRQATMFILIGSVIINRLTFDVLETYIKQGTAARLAKEFTTKVGAFVIIALVLAASLHFINEKKDDKFIDESTYPVAACDYIVENLDTQNIKIYNDYNYGSYMLFRNIPVFIDSRADLYAPEFNTETGNTEDGKDIFGDFINVSSIATYYEPMFDKYEMTHVITTDSSKLSMLIDKRNDDKYNKIYSDDNFVIYEIERNDK